MKITESELAKCVCRLLTVILASMVATSGAPGATAEDKVVQMEKFVVNGEVQLGFGIGITLWSNKDSHRVMEMYIKGVQPGSRAEQEGLRPGTRIWSVDAVPAESFEATFAPDSALGKKFVNRKRGDTIVLEVKVQTERATRFVVLTQSPVTMTVRVLPAEK